RRAFHALPEAIEVLRQRAGLELGSLLPLCLGALSRSVEHVVDPLPLDDDRAVRIEHDDVAGPYGDASDLDRLVDLAHDVLVGSARPDVSLPDREPELAQRVDV